MLSVKTPQIENEMFLLDRWLINIEICNKRKCYVMSCLQSTYMIEIFIDHYVLRCTNVTEKSLAGIADLSLTTEVPHI